MKSLLLILSFITLSSYAQTPQFKVGQRVIYQPDDTLARVTKVKGDQICVKFDYPRFDGDTDRCGIKPSKFMITDLKDEDLAKVADANEPFKKHDRVVYIPDGAEGSILSFSSQSSQVCMKFDQARPDGEYDRCGISSDLVRLSVTAAAPIIGGDYEFKAGVYVTYTPDGASARIIEPVNNTETACLRFNKARPDGAFERCGISTGLIKVKDTSGVKGGKGNRIQYSDGALGMIIDVDPGTDSYCIRFDSPRPDGEYTRCEVPGSTFTITSATNPILELQAGTKVYYTPDFSTGEIQSVDVDAYTVCMRFDQRRPDGAGSRCGISATLIKKM